MASVAQTIANGGVRSPTPIVSDPELQSAAQPVQVTSKENARVMRSLMEAVVDYGTGSAAAISGVQVAGKTGTAELGPKPNQPDPGPLAPGQEAPDPEQMVDAWFIAFAPARKPKIAVAVMLVDADGDGGEVAAPIAREILAAGTLARARAAPAPLPRRRARRRSPPAARRASRARARAGCPTATSAVPAASRRHQATSPGASCEALRRLRSVATAIAPSPASAPATPKKPTSTSTEPAPARSSTARSCSSDMATAAI